MRNLAILCIMFIASVSNCFPMPDMTKAWQAIYERKYELAGNEIRQIKKDNDICDPEDHLHYLMMELVIAIKSNDVFWMEYHMLSIHQIVYLEYMREWTQQIEQIQRDQGLLVQKRSS